ncbi:MAG: hypothetical protein ACXWNC_07520, partial [Anaerolineales bacterium]
MSKRQSSKRSERRIARARKRLLNKFLLIGVIVVVLAVVTWLLWFSKPSKPAGIQPQVTGGPTP